MRMIRRLLCAALAGLIMIALAVALAEEGGDPSTPADAAAPMDGQAADPTAEPTPESAAEPTPQPTADPTAEPTPESAAESTPQPTAEPTPESAAEATPEPTAEPTPESAAEPTPGPAAEPTPGPAAEATPGPAAEATPEPAAEPTPDSNGKPADDTTAAAADVGDPTDGPTDEPPVDPADDPAGGPTDNPAGDAAIGTLAISVQAAQGVTLQGDSYLVSDGTEAKLVFSWPLERNDETFHVRVMDGQGTAVNEAVQAETTFEQSVAGFPSGRYVFAVEAIVNGAVVAEGRCAFAVVFGEGDSGGEVPAGNPSGGMNPEGFPGWKGFGGFRFPSGFVMRGGKVSAGSAGAEMGMEADGGFGVTPGEALTRAHVSGDRNMALYGTLALTLPTAGMTQLMMGGEALEISLDGGESAFTAQIEGDRLLLKPATAGTTWTLNGLAIKTLMRSGISVIELSTHEAVIALPTDQAMQGEVYARLCAEGFVSADYDYRVSGAGTVVCVGGQEYRLDASGELFGTEG